MRAAVFYGREDLRLESYEEPQAGPGDVKLKVHYNGICGSDLTEYFYGPMTTREAKGKAAGAGAGEGAAAAASPAATPAPASAQHWPPSPPPPSLSLRTRPPAVSRV